MKKRIGIGDQLVAALIAASQHVANNCVGLAIAANAGTKHNGATAG